MCNPVHNDDFPATKTTNPVFTDTVDGRDWDQEKYRGRLFFVVSDASTEIDSCSYVV